MDLLAAHVMETLRTERLVLRPLRPADAAFVAHALSDWEVVRWVSGPPWPYGTGDAEAFVAAPPSPTWLIEAGGAPMGVVSSGDELGYWLARPAWGRGIATEAARAVAAHRLADPGLAELRSSHYVGNEASRRVLAKLGFRDAGPKRISSRALGADVDARAMRLTRADWGGKDDP